MHLCGCGRIHPRRRPISRKGDRLHRILGLTWSALMLTVNTSAFSMYDVNGGLNLFHFFAVASLVALIPGFWAARQYALTRERRFLWRHAWLMAWAYFGLAAAGISQLVPRAMPFAFTNLGRVYIFIFILIGVGQILIVEE